MHLITLNRVQPIVGGGIFYVDFTYENNAYVTDCNFADAEAAYLGGQFLIGRFVSAYSPYNPYINFLYLDDYVVYEDAEYPYKELRFKSIANLNYPGSGTTASFSQVHLTLYDDDSVSDYSITNLNLTVTP